MKRIAQIEQSYLKDNLPEFGSGDTVRVHVKIKEGDKERVQVFQGTVIGRRGGGAGATFTVRKISSGIGVERVFPLHSPNIARIERVRAGKVRRAKLYYLRDLTGKSARIREQFLGAEDLAEVETPGTAAAAEEQALKIAAEKDEHSGASKAKTEVPSGSADTTSAERKKKS